MACRRVKSDGDEINQNSTVSDLCLISELPISLLHEIFFRLPIKGIMRCKCVCPVWNNLLSQPIFSENYAKKSPFTALLHKTYTIPFSGTPRMYMLEVSENAGDYIRSHSFVEPESSLWFLGSPLLNIGTCNGFLCMRVCRNGSDKFYVTNPIMGDSIQLPSFKTDMVPGSGRIVSCHFGCSRVTNKFKVLRIVFKSINDCNVEECDIVTVGVDDMWRRLSIPFTDLPVRSDSVVLNGVVHWLPNNKGPDLISTFDLAEEEFGRISIPPSLLLVSKPVKLVVLGNRLGLVDSSVSSQISIWTMDEKSVLESWTKVVVLTSWFPAKVYTHRLLTAELRNGDILPVAELQNGDILFQCTGNSLFSCNIEQKRCSLFMRPQDFGCRAYYFSPKYTPNFSSHAKHIIEREEGLLLRADVIMKKRHLSTATVQQE